MRPTKLGLQIHAVPDQLEMRRQPWRLALRSDPGTLNIESERARVSVDSRQVRAEMGAATPEILRQEWVQDCRASGLRAIERMANEGDRMAAIETGEDAIVAIASDSGYSGLHGMAPEEIMASANVALVPNSWPKMEWSGGRVRIGYEPGRVEATWQAGRLSIEATRAQVEFRVQQIR